MNEDHVSTTKTGEGLINLLAVLIDNIVWGLGVRVISFHIFSREGICDTVAQRIFKTFSQILKNKISFYSNKDLVPNFQLKLNKRIDKLP